MAKKWLKDRLFHIIKISFWFANLNGCSAFRRMQGLRPKKGSAALAKKSL